VNAAVLPLSAFHHRSVITIDTIKEKTMSKKKSPMTPQAASRIQSSYAKKNNGKVPSDSFVSRSSSAGIRNQNKKES
jgi:hypothetical protein|tara:strand:- start:370 stop:600 length:231 start_codon:yes stop_codon:yes gene_type:complete